MTPPTDIVVLLSGGLDSAVTLAILRSEGHRLHGLTINYGQRHVIEVERAERIAAHYGIDHRVLTLDLRMIGGSALTSDLSVPKDRPEHAEQIPITYVPARNTVFLSLALAWAEVLDARAIALGVNAVDYSGYPDCRPAFIEAFQRLARLATRAAVEDGRAPTIVTPLIGLTKAEIIRRGATLGVPFHLTHSCYDPEGGGACGRCDSCRIRRRGFEAAGVPDSIRYVDPAAVGRG
jgi:7-cyano-7-deazaguanine synthase